MKSQINDIINSYVALKPTELASFNQLLIPLHFDKGEVFLAQGKQVDHIAFIAGGVFEMYKTDERGVEISIDFIFPGNFATDYISYLTQTPCEISIRAIQATDTLLIKRQDLDNLYESNIQFQKLGRLLAEQSFIDFAKNIRESFLPVEERYQRIVKNKPHWIQNIPQYKIASYLNISAEWLSKIRAKV